MKKLLKRMIPDTHPIRLAAHRLKNGFAALRAGYPARMLTVIAVTGTDGKTTTVAMIAHILQSAGIKTGAVSTAFFQIGTMREANPTQKTSVDATTLQSFLKRLVREECTHVVIEASSHGLLQGRLSGIRPQVAAVTNVTMEHLDYHGSMEEYAKAKALVFRSMRGHGVKVLNGDDHTYALFQTIPSDRTIVYSPKTQLSRASEDANGVAADLAIGNVHARLTLPMHGMFNLENALCAVTCAEALGLSAESAAKSLSTFHGAGGRMEEVLAGQPFRVFVDFTVTPAAYERTLQSARRMATGRVLVLTGSCGDRMKEKRPLVGKLCAEHADIVAVTNEDPYTEDPEAIIDDVLSGIPASVTVYRESVPGSRPQRFCVRISDRLKAIRFLLKEARAGDIVLLCGKGADVTMMTAKGQIPWNEREIAAAELRKIVSA